MDFSVPETIADFGKRCSYMDLHGTVKCYRKPLWPSTADYKGLRDKTRNFVFLPNAIRTLLFHKLLTTSEHTMNIEIISFYVSKECKNMQSLLQLSSVVVRLLISELGQSNQTRENIGVVLEI